MLLITVFLPFAQVAPVSAISPRMHASAAQAAPGREIDARVAAIAFRLATAGRSNCPTLASENGLVLQHLSQFAPADHPGMIAALALDRGPAVIAVVPGSPAAIAGVHVGDVLLEIDGAVLPPESGLAGSFDAARARLRADVVHDLLAGTEARTLTLLRDGGETTVRLVPAQACPAQVHLARSGQRNAYADGRHVLLTTGLVARLANDDEIAFTIAHEMAHNILGHAAVMRGAAVKRGLGRTLGKSGEIVRAAERDADALAGALMLDAGLDPVRGAEAVRRVEGADLGIARFAAHASASERIKAMRTLAAARRAQ